MYKQKKEVITLGGYIEINIESTKKHRIINIGKGTYLKERK